VGDQHHAPAALPLGKKPGTHSTGGWVVIRAGLVGCRKSRSHRDSIPDRPARSQQLSRPLAEEKIVTNSTQLWLYGLVPWECIVDREWVRRWKEKSDVMNTEMCWRGESRAVECVVSQKYRTLVNPFRPYVGPHPTLRFSCSRRFS
jgi:hypothetical protein